MKVRSFVRNTNDFFATCERDDKGWCTPGDGGPAGDAHTVATLEDKIPLDDYGRKRGVVDLGEVKVKAYRVGALEDRAGRGGIFFSGDEESTKGYASLHGGQEVKPYTVHLKNAVLAGHQGDLTQKFFGKPYGEMMDKVRSSAKFKGRPAHEASAAFDKKIAAEASKRGYDGIIYTSPAPPAKNEVMVLSKKGGQITANAKGKRTSGRNLLRMDPSRTLTIRTAFAREVKKQFRRLKGQLYNLIVKDDAFGLVKKEVIRNVFCPTGEGGGQDNSCGPTGGSKTDSPAFKEWFGDSKIVDGEGKPLVVYHGTPTPGFDSFNLDKAGSNTGNNPEDVAYHFSNSTQAADYYADLGSGKGGVYPVYLRMTNPFITDEKVINESDITRAKNAGHDGIISTKATKTGNEYIVFQGEQIKSAIGNRGTYSKTDRNINNAEWKAILNSWCPTGPGGGKDPTCSPGGVSCKECSAVAIKEITGENVTDVARTLSETIFAIEDAGYKRDATPTREWRGKTVSQFAAEANYDAALVSVTAKPGEYDAHVMPMIKGRLSNLAGYGGELITTVIEFKKITTLNAFCPTGEGGGVDPSCSPGGGSGGAVGMGAGTKDDPVRCGVDIKLAAKALSEGKYIELHQPKQVSTLMDEMHKMAQDAVAKGKNAPKYDLCKVSVPGTNLFCEESVGIPRAQMPQMRGMPVEGSPASLLPTNKKGKVDIGEQFVAHLRDEGIKVKEMDIRASHLRASQNEIDGARVAELVQTRKIDDLRKRPIFVTSDNYVIDGHHHWAAIVGHGAVKDKDYKVPVYRIDMGIGEAIWRANNFAKEQGIKPKSVPGKAAANVFCPTGEGGGVDPSCSPGGENGRWLAQGEGGHSESDVDRNWSDRQTFHAAVSAGKVSDGEHVVEPFVYHVKEGKAIIQKNLDAKFDYSTGKYKISEREMPAERIEDREYIHGTHLPLKAEELKPGSSQGKWGQNEYDAIYLAQKGATASTSSNPEETIWGSHTITAKLEPGTKIAKSAKEIREAQDKHPEMSKQGAIEAEGYHGVAHLDERGDVWELALFKNKLTHNMLICWSHLLWGEITANAPNQFKFESSEVLNAFCPTGEGGGVDPSCSPGGIDDVTGLPLNKDGTVTLYHHTSADKAAAIRKTGSLKSAGEPDVYVTTTKETNTGYGSHAVAIRFNPEALQIDDEFPNGRKDFKISVGKPGGSIKVRVDNALTANAPNQFKFETSEVLNVFCPTGEGGGVDASCSPGGDSASVKDAAEDYAKNGTKSKAFKEWFGDSKVVDEKGEPLVVYHGTDMEFDEFKKGVVQPLGGPDAQGFYMTSDKKYAGGYGGKVMPVFLSIRNPYYAPKDSFEHTQIKTAQMESLMSRGHDGVIFTGDVSGKYPSEYVVFSPSQIKAVANRGTFDPKSAKILNAFCPTGEGGGIDPSCSPGQSHDRVGELNLPGVTNDEMSAVSKALDSSLSVAGREIRLAKLSIGDSDYSAHYSGSRGEVVIGKDFLDYARDIDSIVAGRNETLKEFGTVNTAKEWGDSPNDVIELEVSHELGHHVEAVLQLDLAKAHREVADAGHDLSPATFQKMSGYATVSQQEAFAEAHALVSTGRRDKMPKEVAAWYDAALKTADPEGLKKYLMNSLAFNAFCPTGEGGGVDATCSPGGGVTASRSGEVVMLKTADGSGSLEMHDKGDQFQIREVSVKEEHRGKGIGVAMYEKAIQEAKAAGKGLRSDTATSVSADHVWQALKRRGYDVERAETELDTPLGKHYAVKDLPLPGGTSIKIRSGKPVWKLKTNAFCPTGEGGGQDNSCSPGGGDGGSVPLAPPQDLDEAESRFDQVMSEAFKGAKREDGSVASYFSLPGGRTVTASLSNTGKVSKPEYGVRIDFGIEGKTTTYMDEGTSKETLGMVRQLRDAVKGLHQKGFQIHVHPSDDKRAEVYSRVLSKAGLKLVKGSATSGSSVWNVLVTNAPNQFKFETSDAKLKAFQAWLKKQLGATVHGKSAEKLWEAYTREGFKKGAGRAFDDINAAEKGASLGEKGDFDFYAGGKEQFLRSSFGRPETVEKVKLLASRSFSDLKNMTSDLATKLGRSLADGLVEGKNPRDVANDMFEDLDISYKRAEVIARTEIIRAHAEGQLNAFDEMGVEEIGVMVEWSTAGDDRVCQECQPMEGVILRVAEAHNMIPRHPNCRCSFIPANVGEDTKDQTRGKADVKGAIGESLEAAGQSKDDWGPDVSISKYRPESLITNLIDFRQALNAWDPDQERDEDGQFAATGEGTNGDKIAERVAMTAGKPDQAMVNIPLSKRGDIDSQIDKFKAGQVAEKKATAKESREQEKKDKEVAKGLFEEHGDAFAERTAAKSGRPKKEVIKFLEQMVKSDPTKARKLLEKVAAESVAKNAWDPDQERDENGRWSGEVYHGSDKSLDKYLDKSESPRASDPFSSHGTWFVEDPSVAKRYGENLNPSNLNIKNPYHMSVDEVMEWDDKHGGIKYSLTEDDVAEIKKDHDAIIFKPATDKQDEELGLDGEWAKTQYVIFDKKNIRKSQDNSSNKSLTLHGGPGSGNFGHEGRPGEVGGSSSEGGGNVPDADTLEHVKDLPGSTGPKLEKDSSGKQYVVKYNHGGNEGHLANEVEADAVYRALGVKVPDSKIDGAGHKVSEFLTLTIPLAQAKTAYPPEVMDKIHENIAKDYVADALLGNWDVAGLGNDNILVKGFTPHRVDNGGAMKYRAMGGLKSKDDWSGDVEKDLKSMRDPVKNPNTAAIYKNLTDDDIKGQIKDVLSKKDAVLAAIKDPINQAAMQERFKNLEKMVSDKAAPAIEVPTPAPTSKAAPSPVVKTLPSTYGGLEAGHTYVNSQNKVQTIESVTKSGTNVVIGFKGGGEATIPASKAFKFTAPEPTTPTPPATPKAPAKPFSTSYAQPTATPAASSPAASTTGGGTAKLATGDALAGKMGSELGHLNLTKLQLAKFAALNPGGLNSKEIIVPRPAHQGGVPGSMEAALAKQKEMVDWVKQHAAPGTEISAPKGWVTAKKAGVTKTFGDVGTFTTTKQDAASTGTASVATDLKKYLPPIVSGGKTELYSGPKYDEAGHSTWRKSLTTSEQLAIGSWKGSAKKIRKAVTSGKTLTGVAKAFMSAIEKSPPYKGVVYRGIHGKYAEGVAQQIIDAGVGGTWSDPAPHCTSLHPYKGEDFSHGQTMFRIVSKTARPIHKEDGFSTDGPKTETEIVGMPGTKYRITGIHKNVVTNHSHIHTGSIKHVIDLVEED